MPCRRSKPRRWADSGLRELPDGPESVYIEVEEWQVLAVDDELRLPLSRETIAERARFLRSALKGQS